MKSRFEKQLHDILITESMLLSEGWFSSKSKPEADPAQAESVRKAMEQIAGLDSKFEWWQKEYDDAMESMLGRLGPLSGFYKIFYDFGRKQAGLIEDACVMKHVQVKAPSAEDLKAQLQKLAADYRKSALMLQQDEQEDGQPAGIDAVEQAQAQIGKVMQYFGLKKRVYKGQDRKNFGQFALIGDVKCDKMKAPPEKAYVDDYGASKFLRGEYREQTVQLRIAFFRDGAGLTYIVYVWPVGEPGNNQHILKNLAFSDADDCIRQVSLHVWNSVWEVQRARRNNSSAGKDQTTEDAQKYQNALRSAKAELKALQKNFGQAVNGLKWEGGGFFGFGGGLAAFLKKKAGIKDLDDAYFRQVARDFASAGCGVSIRAVASQLQNRREDYAVDRDRFIRQRQQLRRNGNRRYLAR